jgi:catechol 2,3-dioxygenase-like lactoylglutathione lyase family enzyme
MPALNGILETALYVDDLDRASHFYEEIFALERIASDDRLRAYSVAGRSVLLLFKRGASNQVTHLPFGTLGPHDGSGQLHFAFSIAAEELAGWETLLAEKGIVIESQIRWPRGGSSLYFRDPDGNLLELVTPGVWSIY